MRLPDVRYVMFGETWGSKKDDELPKMDSPKAGFRPELQGLRAVAVMAVLIFHCWGNTFKVGYLGVDVFFVISGYLMCRMLVRKLPLTKDWVLEFYFRRIKRIVPIYLSVIALTLFLAKQYVSKLDYQQLIDEAIPSVFFYSNAPSVHKHEYFDLKSKYFFFLHSWSLSVEMQFYLIVPALFFAAQRLQKASMILGSAALLFGLSILRQTFNSGDSQHMLLDGRLWQFLCGFGAYFLFEAKFLKSAARIQKCSTTYPTLHSICGRAGDLLINGALYFLLLIFISPTAEIQRILAVFVATLLIALPNGSESLLTTEPFVRLGDVSYSVYLIHWPVMTIHRFIDAEHYKEGADASVPVGVFLMVISIGLGFAVEKLWAKALRNIKSWTSLLLTLLFLLAVIGLLILKIRADAFTLETAATDTESEEIIDEDGDIVTQHTEMLWRTRNDRKALPTSDSIMYNAEIASWGEQNRGCPFKENVLPTRYAFDYSLPNMNLCHEVLDGKKHIVIIGNSHAYHNYMAIRYHFADIAADITLISRGECTPSSQRMGQTECVRFWEQTVDSLKQWETPIDIIIPIYGYESTTPDEEPVENWKTDGYYNFLQRYYDQLSEIAQEVVFVPLMNLYFEEKQMKVLQDRLISGGPVGEMGEPLEKQLDFLPGIRERLEHIECDNCIPMNWYKIWCQEKRGKFCRTVETFRSLALFLDQHHPTPYGSMFVGNALRERYNEFMR